MLSSQQPSDKDAGMMFAQYVEMLVFEDDFLKILIPVGDRQV